MAQGHLKLDVMNETIDENKIESLPPPPPPVVEDSIASRTKEITKRPKRERSPTVQIQPPAPKIKKIKEVAPKLPDKTKWTMEEQKQFFSALRIYGKNFEALGQCFNTRRRLVNPEAQKRTFGQIRCFYYRSFRTVSKLCTFTDEEKSNVDSLELRSVLAYLCLKPKVKCFDKKPTISVLHQLIRNGNAFLRVKGQREHVSIIGKALKPPKTTNTLGSTKQNDRTLSKHIKILLSPASANAYMRVALACRYPHVELFLSRTTNICELIDKLNQYWQLNSHAQSLLKDDSSMEQLILYPHGSYASSSSTESSLLPSNDLTSALDLSSRKPSISITTDKNSRSRSDSEHSTEPFVPTTSDTSTRKRNNLSESEAIPEPIANTTTSVSSSSAPSTPAPPPSTAANKSNLARTAILLAAKRAASNHNTNSNNYDGGFTLIDGTEDEADSCASLFRQRFETIELNDEFVSEDEIENDTNVPLPLTVPAPVIAPTLSNSPTITLADVSQGIDRNNRLFSTLTIGDLQKLLQRPKELRFLYDFSNSSRPNNGEISSPTAFLHYVIQMANQCLTAIAERQQQPPSSEIKTTKKSNTKKPLNSRSKCYCSCCSHHHHPPPQLHGGNKEQQQRRSSTKTANSPNAEMCAFLQMPQSIPSQDLGMNINDELSTVQSSLQVNMNNNTNMVSDGDLNNKPPSLLQLEDQSDIFDSLPWSTDTGTMSIDQSQPPPPSSATTTTSTTTELPSLLTLLMPMMNTVESTPPPPPPPQPKPPAIIFSSNNGVIDDPFIQSLAAEQAASAHNYDLLSHRYKRVRRPLRYGDQSTRPSNIQFLLDANLNAQQTAAAAAAAAAANQHLMFNGNNLCDLPTISNSSFSADCENPNDLLNDNTNMSTVSLSTTIVNAALQSNTSRLRLDWPDNMSDLSFGSFPDLLESNTPSATAGDLNNFEQSSTTTNSSEQNKCASESSISEALFAINNATNLLLQN